MNKLPAILLLAFTLGFFMSAPAATAGTATHHKNHTKHAKHHHVRHHKTGK